MEFRVSGHSGRIVDPARADTEARDVRQGIEREGLWWTACLDSGPAPVSHPSRCE